MEQIVFPVPNICEYLTEESKVRVFTTTERDDQGSKVNDFFQKFDNLYNEMRWQKKIRSKSLHSESSQNNESGSSSRLQDGKSWLSPRVSGYCYSRINVRVCSDFVCLCPCTYASCSVFYLYFLQKIRLCSGSHVISLFGGASPSTWPVWSTSSWLYSTLSVMMEMRVRISATSYLFNGSIWGWLWDVSIDQTCPGYLRRLKLTC